MTRGINIPFEFLSMADQMDASAPDRDAFIASGVRYLLSSGEEKPNFRKRALMFAWNAAKKTLDKSINMRRPGNQNAKRKKNANETQMKRRLNANETQIENAKVASCDSIDDCKNSKNAVLKRSSTGESFIVSCLHDLRGKGEEKAEKKESFPPAPPYKEKRGEKGEGKENDISPEKDIDLGAISRPCASAPTQARKVFVKPTVEEVSAYCRERNNGIDAQQFIDFYESKGWVVGKSPMKDWRAAVRTWERSRNPSGGTEKQGYHRNRNGAVVGITDQKQIDEFERRAFGNHGDHNA